MHTGHDYIMRLKSPKQVRDAAAALSDIDRAKLRTGYNRIVAASYGIPLSDEDFDYTWHWFQELAAFYQRAAAAGHSVLFPASQ
jgi:hypothetical protein